MPSRPNTIESTVISVRIPSSWIPILDQVAKKQEESRNRVMRDFINTGIEKFRKQEDLQSMIKED